MSNVHKKVSDKADLFRGVFDTTDGKKVMAELEAELNPDNIFDIDPHVTGYNLGKRDAFIYIKQLINYRPKEE